MRYFDDTGECVGCKVIKEELGSKKRVVLESEHFVVFIPYGAFSPFHTWIFPKKHVSSFGDINDAELGDLAGTLKNTLAKLYHGLGDPDYNYCIRSTPNDVRQTDHLHWHISIIPRITKTAGFELDASSEINANPADTRDYEKGVWTLPPSLELGDQDRNRYLAIGESDRMTLRFVKPAG